MSSEQFDLEKALHDIRDINDKLKDRNFATVDDKVNLEKKYDALSKKLEEQEEANQKLTLEVKKSEQLKDELTGQVNLLEKQICRIGSGNSEYRQKSDSIKALESYVAYGEMNDVVKSYLRTDNNVQGGFLMKPEDVDNMIIKPITETSPIRQLARMRKVNTLKAATVTRDILLTAYWTGEGENRTSSNSQYGKKEISVNSMTGKVEVTNEALLDSMFDIENEIMSDMNEYFAQAEGSAFVNGDGVKKPLGFMSTSAGLTRFNSGSAATFDFDALIKLAGQLKTGYNPIYGMNRQVAAFVRTLKDGNGQYVWQMGNMAAGVPNSINGYAYVELPDMSATIGANSENVIFADFSKMYEVVDAFQAIVTRNPYILQDEGKTVTYVQRFVGGGVLLKEAGVVLKCAV